MTEPEYHTTPGDLGDTIAAGVTSSAAQPELTKRHGTTLRLTAAGERRMNRCLRKLCTAGMPGTEIRATLNRKFRLDWTLATYFQRVQKLGFRWTPSPHRPPNVDYLADEKRKACLEDPAWEARNGMVDQVICRECFAILQDGAMHGKRGHGQTQHEMDLKQYRLLHPAAPVFTLQRMAKQERVDVQTKIAARVKDYATPEEYAAAEKDPKYYQQTGITKYVICLVLLCYKLDTFCGRPRQSKHL